MSTKSRACHASTLAVMICTALMAMPMDVLRAEGGDGGILIPAEYASLPSNEEIDGPNTTGALPEARALSGFASLVSRGAITLRTGAPTGCIPGNLREVVASVAERFGPVSVESTHRNRGRNWRAGGARHSLHLSCRAVDFRVRTRLRGVMAYLRSHPQVGGLKIYRNGIIHIDNGERRSW